MSKLGGFRVFGTKKGTQKSLELDEISIIAGPNELKEIGMFFINSAREVEINDTEHIHLKDQSSDFSSLENVDGHVQAARDLKAGLNANILEYQIKGCNSRYKKLPSSFKRVSKMKIPTRPR